jgi:hypothetical protein
VGGAGPVAESDAVTEPEPVTESEPESESESEPESESESEPESDAVAVAEPESESVAESDAVAESGSGSDAVAESDGTPRAREARRAPRGTLAEELALIRGAQDARERGEPGHALSLLRRHRRRFPSGLMAEEREAERVQSLCALGRVAQGHRVAGRFLERYAGSPLSSRVRRACEPEESAP